MLPVIVIVGRSNVGKSTLFNRLTQITQTQRALVANIPGVTRDRLYGEAIFQHHRFIVIDTGGLETTTDELSRLWQQQSWLAIGEADVIFFVVDAKIGITTEEVNLAKKLRRLNKPIYLLINKTENQETALISGEFYRLGFKFFFPISAAHGQGIQTLLTAVTANFSEPTPKELLTGVMRIAVIGRPNVGKSTLINRLLGEQRVVVFDVPGTTRDSIYIPFQRGKQKYILIDTAGVRRRRGISEALEKFSVIKSLQAIEVADVVLVVMDARENITEQDLRLVGFIIEAGKAFIIVINKWDDLPLAQRKTIQAQIDRRLQFAQFARIQFISALQGSGVGKLWQYIQEAYQAATQKFPTSALTCILEMAVKAHPPPVIQGKMMKLRYAHLGGHQPPLIIIHGKHIENVAMSYRRYLMNYFIKALRLHGTPVRIEFKNDGF